MINCDKVGGAPLAARAPIHGPAAVGRAPPVAQRPVSLATHPWRRPFMRVWPGRNRPVGPRGQRDVASQDVLGGHSFGCNPSGRPCILARL
eukprot:8012141-Alexandrium_andersonii.AAC.1